MRRLVALRQRPLDATAHRVSLECVLALMSAHTDVEVFDDSSFGQLYIFEKLRTSSPNVPKCGKEFLSGRRHLGTLGELLHHAACSPSPAVDAAINSLHLQEQEHEKRGK